MDAKFHIEYRHRILQSKDVFAADNQVLPQLLSELSKGKSSPCKVLLCLEKNLSKVTEKIEAFATQHSQLIELCPEPLILKGGESCKNDFGNLEDCWAAIDKAKLDRHSQIWIIGGGAFLDLVSFAASTAHRGIRHLRFPTTTLSQGDAGVGVKNAINYLGKKNWLGTFSVPSAVINDSLFLESLSPRELRDGLIEALKVALVKDEGFYQNIQNSAEQLQNLELPAIENCIQRSAEIHVEHVTQSGDPFEQGSARPLDFGHWAAHKLEQLSNFGLSHGEAVAIGIALDTLYSEKSGLVDANSASEIIALIQQLGFQLWHPSLEDSSALLTGLEEFREHLGGELHITLLEGIGKKIEVQEIDKALIEQCLSELKKLGELKNQAA